MLLLNINEIKWRQHFDNFEIVYMLLQKHTESELESEIERAGYIHFFEMVIEHANKVMISYLEAKNEPVTSPRDQIKKLHKLNIVQNDSVWFKIQNRKNLVFYIHNQDLSQELVTNIKVEYLPEVESFYRNLKKIV
ncbi:HI0074 family nucleotidyltransferase substrate-binding subunit [Bacillaceae bacterium W0354]